MMRTNEMAESIRFTYCTSRHLLRALHESLGCGRPSPPLGYAPDGGAVRNAKVNGKGKHLHPYLAEIFRPIWMTFHYRPIIMSAKEFTRKIRTESMWPFLQMCGKRMCMACVVFLLTHVFIPFFMASADHILGRF